MREHEIRPEALLKKYIELSSQDAQKCFQNNSRQLIQCIACDNLKTSFQFEKDGFGYVQCNNCKTLFQSPRPPISEFEAFYRQSESSRYWAEVFFPAVAEARREKIFRPRVVRLSELCFKQGFSINRLIDVGAGYGIFLDEWRKSFPNTSLLAVEPSASLANECRTKGFEIAEDIVENVIGYDDSADLVTCFEVLEHTYSPLNFLFALKKLARPGGLVFISTLGIDGFDLQMLWEKSTQISPPHHINFISINGFKDLFQRAGLVDIKILTPGQLDVDIVRNVARRDASLLSNNRFLYNLLNDDQKSSEFQKFLSENLLSSHVWILGMKPEK